MIVTIRAKLKNILRDALPPSLAHDAPNMRFSTTEKTWLASEARYLFLTENGPIEVSFRPLRIAKITGGITAILLFGFLAGPVFIQTITGLPPLPSTAENTAPEQILPEQILPEQSVPALAITQAPLPTPREIDGLLEDGLSAARELASSAMLPAHSLMEKLTNWELQSSTPDAANRKEAASDPQAGKPAQEGAQATVKTPQINTDTDADTEQAALTTPPSDRLTALPEESPDNYISVVAAQLGNLSEMPITEDVIAPLPRPKAEPMDPEFVSFDSLADAPRLDERVQIHRLFADYLSQAEQVEAIINRFDIRLDSQPSRWLFDAEPSDAVIPELFLHRDNWLKILNQIPLKSPLRYYYVTSSYGMRTNKKTGVTRFHHGIDLAGTWRAQLRPSASGVVSFAGRDGSFGKLVRVRHAHNIETVYAHLSSINVKKGDYVTDNVVIGKMGNTGRSDGMHLHYEILINGKSIDPALFFKIGHQLTNTGGLPRAISF